MGVRNTVGHNVIKVPSTVTEMKPRMLNPWWASSSRLRHGSRGENAMIAPRLAPNGNRQAAAA